ncbi:HTH-type transcriptional repressor PurR [compost metagenome]
MEAGVRIPEEVSIVGYDDHYIASQLRPHLTTLRQPADKIGLAAADMLLKRIGGTMKRGANVRIDPELIVRESTSSK